MAALEDFRNETVSVITNDGRHIVGTLKGFDQTINIILEDSHERLYSTEDPVEQIPYGLLVLRGDNIATVGLLDTAVDNSQNLAAIRADPLNPVTH